MKQIKRPFLIAVTGGIASGKTEVCRIFQKNKFRVYFSDKIAHKILEQAEIIKELVKKFGRVILFEEKINRSKLAEIVFSSVENIEFINRLLHPPILKKIDEIIGSSNENYLVFEIPLLFEKKLQNSFDLTINVFSDYENQVQRQALRDNASDKTAKKKIKSQMPNLVKKKLADINLENNDQITDLINKVEIIISKLSQMGLKKTVKLLNSGD